MFYGMTEQLGLSAQFQLRCRCYF